MLMALMGQGLQRRIISKHEFASAKFTLKQGPASRGREKGTFLAYWYHYQTQQYLLQ